MFKPTFLAGDFDQKTKSDRPSFGVPSGFITILVGLCMQDYRLLQRCSCRAVCVDHCSTPACAECCCASCPASGPSVAHHPSSSWASLVIPVKYRIKFKVAVFMHQVTAQRCPSYVADLGMGTSKQITSLFRLFPVFYHLESRNLYDSCFEFGSSR